MGEYIRQISTFKGANIVKSYTKLGKLWRNIAGRSMTHNEIFVLILVYRFYFMFFDLQRCGIKNLFYIICEDSEAGSVTIALNRAKLFIYLLDLHNLTVNIYDEIWFHKSSAFLIFHSDFTISIFRKGTHRKTTQIKSTLMLTASLSVFANKI